MNWRSELHRLESLQDDLALLPIGSGSDRKGPLLSGWTTHSGLTVKDLAGFRNAIGVGGRTGLMTGPLMCWDFDGRTAFDLGLNPADFKTWQIHRDSDPFRLKVIGRPTPDQIAQLPEVLHLPKGCHVSPEFQGKKTTAPPMNGDKGEALEVFFAGGRQVVVLGQHYKSGGNYFWPDGLGPEALAAPPQEWLDFAIQIADGSNKNIVSNKSRPSATRNGTRKLDPCPICGRHSGKGGSSLWCDETSDGLILCMPGSTFSAEQRHGSLSVEDVVNGYVLVKRTPHGDGDVLTFKPHVERPLTRKERTRKQLALARIAVFQS